MSKHNDDDIQKWKQVDENDDDDNPNQVKSQPQFRLLAFGKMDGWMDEVSRLMYR